MTYLTFKHMLKVELKKSFGSEFKVISEIVPNNNSTPQDAIIIIKEGFPIANKIWVAQFYQEYCLGTSLEEIVSVLKESIMKTADTNSDLVEKLNDFECVKDRIVYRLLSRESNDNLLKQVPWLPFMDIAIVFYISVDSENTKQHMLITNEMLKHWEISIDILFKQAHMNTSRISPPVCINIEALYLGLDLDNDHDIGFYNENGLFPLYALSNRSMKYGAVCILYEGLLSSIAEALNDDLIIYPSSIHEMIICPLKYSKNKEESLSIVQICNENEMEKQDVLTCNVYKFDKTSKKLEIWSE